MVEVDDTADLVEAVGNLRKFGVSMVMFLIKIYKDTSNQLEKVIKFV